MLAEAVHLARRENRARSAGTEHLLAGLLEVEEVSAWLRERGLDVKGLAGEFAEAAQADEEAVELPIEGVELDLTSEADAIDLGRILDASANRAGEGLRVVDDYVRFVLGDPMLSRRAKEVRHRFGAAVRGLDPALRLASRDTQGDVGTHISTPSERIRENPRAVLAANFQRTAEALRSLEEYSKLLDIWLASRFESLRYDVYVLEKLVQGAVASQESLGAARLYVLIGGMATLGELQWVVSEAIEGGAQVIQLREKGLSDRELLRRAVAVRELTLRAGVRLVLNDRPDLARLCGADGVHLGQDDLSVRDARRVLGPRGIIGVSTHETAQLERAVLDGATYLGVGPVFATETKSFEQLAGLVYVREAAAMSRVPWFAIGGIGLANIDDVIGAGASRVAVSSAVVRAPSPRAAAAQLRERLEAAGA